MTWENRYDKCNSDNEWDEEGEDCIGGIVGGPEDANLILGIGIAVISSILILLMIIAVQ